MNIPDAHQNTSRLAGFLYLLTVPLGVFNFMYIPTNLTVVGDAVATANKIMAHELLFRLGIVSALLGAIIPIFYLLLLYKLLKTVNKNIAVLMIVLAMVGMPIVILNEVFQLGALHILSGISYLSIFTTTQLQSLAYLLIRLHSYGVNLAFIFSGLWLLPLGYLVFKSRFLPKILGILLIVGGFGYLIDVFSSFLYPLSNLSLGLITGLSEILFALWLLVKGINVKVLKEND